MRNALIAFLEYLISLLNQLPQKPAPPAAVKEFVLKGSDRELISQFLQSTQLTEADSLDLFVQ